MAVSKIHNVGLRYIISRQESAARSHMNGVAIVIQRAFRTYRREQMMDSAALVLTRFASSALVLLRKQKWQRGVTALQAW